MSNGGPAEAPEPSGVTPQLPRIDDLPVAPDGYDPERVREAFETFRRQTAQLQAQLRVLQTAKAAQLEPTGHAVRMDALHLIRAAAEFADTLERDAQDAAAAQLGRAEEEIRVRYEDVERRRSEFESFRAESERQRDEILNAAKGEAAEILAQARADASREAREAEAGATRLLEQARQQAMELTNSARAEVEHTLEWARAHASGILTRAQRGAGQLLGSAGLGEAAAAETAAAIVRTVEQTGPPPPAGLTAPAAHPTVDVADAPGADERRAHPFATPSAMAWAEPNP